MITVFLLNIHNFHRKYRNQVFHLNPVLKDLVPSIIMGDSDRVSEKVGEPVAAGFDKFLRDSWYTSEMDKLSKLYPRIENMAGLKVPKLDMEVYQLVDQNVRNTDQSFQTIQRALIAGFTALAPILDLAFQRGNKDAELDPLTKNLLHGMQLLLFGSNAISTRRKEVLKPCLAPAYARVLTKGHDLPFINMDPNNLRTLYTALEFAPKKCRKFRRKT